MRALVLEALALRGEPFEGRLCLALARLLMLLEREPLLARVWLVESLSAGPRVQARREQRMGELREAILAASPMPLAVQRPPLAGEGTFASVRGVVVEHLARGEPREGELIGQLGALMGLIAAPYLRGEQLVREVARGKHLADALAPAAAVEDAGAGASDAALPAPLANPTAFRARAVLAFLVAHPGASNREVARGAGDAEDADDDHAQNGAVLKQSTQIAATGCPKRKRAAHHARKQTKRGRRRK